MQRWRAVLYGLLLIAPAGPWVAAQAVATPLDSWEPHCYQDETSKARICTTELRAMGGEREFAFYFARGPQGPVPLIAQAEGLDLMAMTVTVDDKAPVEADRCEADLCFFESAKSRGLIRAFKKGAGAHIVIRDRASRVVFDQVITLLGFSAAYSRYR